MRPINGTGNPYIYEFSQLNNYVPVDKISQLLLRLTGDLETMAPVKFQNGLRTSNRNLVGIYYRPWWWLKINSTEQGFYRNFWLTEYMDHPKVLQTNQTSTIVGSLADPGFRTLDSNSPIYHFRMHFFVFPHEIVLRFHLFQWFNYEPTWLKISQLWVMVWHWTGDNSLPEPHMPDFTDACKCTKDSSALAMELRFSCINPSICTSLDFNGFING